MEQVKLAPEKKTETEEAQPAPAAVVAEAPNPASQA